jgi:hypothetical protein
MSHASAERAPRRESGLAIVEDALVMATFLRGARSGDHPWIIDESAQQEIARLIRKVSPAISDRGLRSFLYLANLSVARLNESQAAVDLKGARQKLASLRRAAVALIDAWSDACNDRALFRVVVDFAETDLAEHPGLRAVGPGPTSAAEKRRSSRQLPRLREHNEWVPRVSHLMSGDLSTLSDRLSILIKALGSRAFKGSPFRYECLWGIADAWFAATGKFATTSRNDGRNGEGSSTPFQECVKHLLGESEARSYVLRDVARAYKHTYGGRRGGEATRRRLKT